MSANRFEKNLMLAAVIFLIFFAFFVSLRSNELFAVDGSYRCFEVYQRQTVFFHGNNHLLYPVNVLLWSRGLSHLGLRARNPLQFLSIVEIMNCLAGAGVLAILFLLLSPIVRSRGLAIVLTTGYGLSQSFLSQATNANEPMVGIFFSFLSVGVAAWTFRTKSNVPVVLAGLALALALASYQSSVLFAPVALFLIILARRRWMPAVLLVLSAVIATICIYGTAYKLMGIGHPLDMAKYFFQLTGAHGFLGPTVGKILALPLGMTASIFPVLRWFPFSGMRHLFGMGAVPLIFLFALPLLLSLLLLSLLVRVLKDWNCTSPAARIGFCAAAIGLACTLLPLLIWDSTYGKLWIQPLACMVVILAIYLDNHPRPVRGRVLLVCLSLGLSMNVVWALRFHRVHYTTKLAEAARFASMVRPNDLVVGEWDTLSTLYSSLWVDDRTLGYRSVWAENRHFVSFSTLAARYGLNAMPRLQNSISTAQIAGGTVYFVGLLDMPESQWNAFFKSRCGIPYSAILPYRDHSVAAGTYQFGPGDVSTVRRLSGLP